MLNKETIRKLIELNKFDRESLDFIKSCIDSFEQYHRAVFEDQMIQIIFGGGAFEGTEYRELRSSADRARTVNHDAIIASVNILNRMADKAGLEAVYDGVVSKERPYRRQVANAVFEYIEFIINNRS